MFVLIYLRHGQALDIRYQMSGIRCQVSGIRYQVSGTRYQEAGIRHQVSRYPGIQDPSTMTVHDRDTSVAPSPALLGSSSPPLSVFHCSLCQPGLQLHSQSPHAGIQIQGY